MVSFWPWRGESSDTASFEKTLSNLSTKIAANQAHLDKLRSRARRVKVLWTLYMTFAFLVYAVVMIAVVGYNRMGAYEWTAMAGGPVLIYATRRLTTGYFNLRIDSLSQKLKEQQEERAKTIQKLKDATKYDSTMELIEKYGGADGKSGKGKKKAAGDGGDDTAKANDGKTGKHPQGPAPSRTTMPPPPTANIQRRTDVPQQQHRSRPQAMEEANAEFAPNAEYTQMPPLAHQHQQPPHQPPESHWYDRVFDVLLGEDETAPKNRIVLLCSQCRLVNGQAPPGVKTLAEIGKWRCMACGAMNGEVAEDEGHRIVREVLGEQTEEPAEDMPVSDSSSDAAEAGDSPAATVKKRRSRLSK
ncbi:uncharacterized protein J7T54_000155 [Emericellopsis cladophorae]|uniref:Endoplasmic reticulum junction formation protein lunapark n=1 Tax=Emericellopsis cladophorae TaxID=2686198 RepID=A0A9Q0BDG0_9HYPO|nr:uncharacterized protein J7T54_000155 [Emericellopsis cladophorae]KAI6780515.1 hypothetical protein J7T54_000155 [Emericellopsis cladophorae]